MSFKTKQKVQQWIKSFLQLTQIYPRHVLKSKIYNVCTFKNGELFGEYIKENWNRFLVTAIQI